MIKELTNNVVSVSKDDTTFNSWLRKGYDITSALCLCLQKIKWYYTTNEVEIKELKNVYHVLINQR